MNAILLVCTAISLLINTAALMGYEWGGILYTWLFRILMVELAVVLPFVVLRGAASIGSLSSLKVYWEGYKVAWDVTHRMVLKGSTPSGVMVAFLVMYVQSGWAILMTVPTIEMVVGMIFMVVSAAMSIASYRNIQAKARA